MALTAAGGWWEAMGALFKHEHAHAHTHAHVWTVPKEPKLGFSVLALPTFEVRQNNSLLGG